MKKDEPSREYSKDLRPVRKYIGILANQYPRPVPRRELAQLANVSKPAITKIAHRLYPLCDTKVLAFERGFVLKSDKRTAGSIVGTFLFKPTFVEFQRSPYVAAMLEKLGPHEIISKAVPEYSKFFTKEDTTFAATLLLQIVAEGMKEMGTLELERLDEKEYAFALGMRIGPIIERSFASLHLFVDEKNLDRLLVFRDKLFFLARALLEKQVLKMRIISTIKDQATVDVYTRVYTHTIDFYLREAFSKLVTSAISEAARKGTIRLPQDYSTIGRFFRPEN